MDTRETKRIETSQEETEKMLVATILNHIGHLLIAKSPFKTKVQQEAEQYRSKLFNSLPKEQREPFVQTRDLLVNLATQLIQSQDRATLSKITSFLKTLEQDKVLFVADPAIEVNQELFVYLNQELGVTALDSQLDDIVNIVYGLTRHNDQERADD